MISTRIYRQTGRPSGPDYLGSSLPGGRGPRSASIANLQWPSPPAEMQDRRLLPASQGGIQAEAVDWTQIENDCLSHPEHGVEAHYILGECTEEGASWARAKLKQIRQ
eukprot:68634-Pyramimonas_sp.AAC.1